LTRKFSTSEEIRLAKPDHDAWISGSDQVFRYYGPESDVFYLDFLQGSSAKKIAYAPSFGTSNVDEKYQHRVGELLRGFDFLSCREGEGAELIRRISGLDAELVVDPVFLLTQEQWRELFFAPAISGRYILVYALVGYQKQLEIAKRIKALTGLPIYVIYPTRIKDGEVAQTLCTTDPYQFGGLIDRADYVVTDSFHGLAFSLLFQKNFFCHIALQHSASRHRSILEILGLTSRLVDCPARISDRDLQINYKISIEILSNLPRNSIRFLNRSLRKGADD
jgi:polysaccharide pyruvyl transferase WcaK-like protein